MPVDPNKLPDDDKSTREVGYSEEGDSHDHEEPDSDSEIFEPLCLRPEQLKYLDDNMIPAERSEFYERVQATGMCFLPESAISDPSESIASILETNEFMINMHRRVTARVSAAGSAVPPTVPQTEQEDDRGEEQEEDEDKGEEEQAPPTERSRSISGTGTALPQTETPTQP